MYTLLQILFWTVAAAITVFVIVSVVLFIRDGISAKTEGRSIKTAYTVMFIISMALVGIAVAVAAKLSILALLIMNSM